MFKYFALFFFILSSPAWSVEGGRCLPAEVDGNYAQCWYILDTVVANGTYPATALDVGPAPKRWALEMTRNTACTAGTATCNTHSESGGAIVHELGAMLLDGTGNTVLFGGESDAPIFRFLQCTVTAEADCTDLTIVLHRD